MNAWTAIDLAVFQEQLLNFGGEMGIFSTMLGRLSVFPGILATLRHLKGLAEHGDGIVVALLCDEGKGESWPREKMPSAFLIYHVLDVIIRFLSLIVSSLLL